MSPKVVLGIGASGDPERPELTHAEWALLPAQAPTQTPVEPEPEPVQETPIPGLRARLVGSKKETK